MEPINCTASVEKGRCRIWAPTQGATTFQMVASKLTGLPVEKVEVNILPAGGGFGLRGEASHVTDAVLLSKALKRPVKVMYTREDDFKNDFFRPANQSRIRALIPGDDDGKVSIENAKVKGMSDFIVLPHSHPFIMKSDDVIHQTKYFLQHGSFEK